jgi:serine/threonine protein kinase
MAWRDPDPNSGGSQGARSLANSTRCLLEGKVRTGAGRTLKSETLALLNDYRIPLVTPHELERRGVVGQLGSDNQRRLINDLYGLLHEFVITETSPMVPAVGTSPMVHAVDNTPPLLAFRDDDDNVDQSRSSNATPFRKGRRRSSVEDAQMNQSRTTPHVTTEDDGAGYSFINQYLVQDTIGTGAQGIVKKVLDSATGENFAMKVLPRPHQRPYGDSVCSEVHIAKQLRHDNIVRLFEVIDDVSHDKVYLIMQLIDGAPLFAIDKSTFACEPRGFSCDTICEIITQIAAGLRYLHRRRIVHRDLKPDNILVESLSGKAMLADFGISQQLTGDGALPVDDNRATTFAFTAPEVFNGQPYTEASDMWAVGVIMFAMIFGHLPFVGDSRFAVKTMANQGLSPSLTVPAPYSCLTRWLRKLLAVDPLQRCTSKELRDAGLTQDVFEASGTDAPLTPIAPTGPPPLVRRQPTQRA